MIKSEERIQQECFIWFNNTYPDLRGLLFHVPNGGSRNIVEATNFKKIGVVPGVSDLIFLYKGSAFCIEMKNSIGYQSKVQLKWQKKVERQGIIYHVCNSRIDFEFIIKKILRDYK